jgi:hypothetical protein
MSGSSSNSNTTNGMIIQSTVGDRKLATIRKIGKITSIPEADSIVCAEIDGWKAVVKKGQFEEGY